jgi:hypothetical protein
MKKFVILGIFLTSLFMGMPGRTIVRAQDINPCKPDPGVVYFGNEDEKKYGFTIYRAEKVGPPKPLVIGQDLQEQTGVEINIEIRSLAGAISYETFDGYRQECRSYSRRQREMKSCFPGYDNGHYFYWTTVPICTLHENEKVYRTIDGESLKVWLLPSEKTVQWLGWNREGLFDDQYPLRYLFPEKWSLGTWTPGGFTTEGDAGLFADFQIEKFTSENPGFNFLKADPRAEKIPSYALMRINDPMGKDGNADLVLALFGGFSENLGHAQQSKLGECLVSRPGTQGKCEVITSELGGNDSLGLPTFEKWKTGLTGGADLTAKDITYLALNLHRVPLDLPGEWQIGLEVSVRAATYDNGRRTEVADPNNLIRNPNNLILNKDKPILGSFTSYIWLVTPCNPAEKDGCTE